MTTSLRVLVRSQSRNDKDLTRDTGFDYWVDDDTPLEVDGIRKIAESAVKSLVKDYRIPREKVLAVFVYAKKNVYRFTSYLNWFNIWFTKYALKFEEVTKEK